ncbi:sugar ABC transporter permease [Planctomonas sp. JC2975]|uniref:carbohydrate ABC transporter permease n=1 Tax=Planctomonas sp. JC2975 TaxID=2729626 RepID=UPI0014753069|nr:sugar ABC transporter permease [Planctomonas sp. JC2975]NNC13694.1 sugar ABC transporter permease [Planctomonas sp. JC2975]
MTAITANATAGARTSSRGRGWKRYRAGTFYLFISPWMFGFVLLTFAPIVYALAVSFTNYDGASPLWRFVGFSNYVEIFTESPDVWASLLRTFGYTILVVPLSVAGGLVLAILVNRRIRARGVVRAIFFVPSVVPVVAVAIMWRLIFNRDAGLLNGILAIFGIHPVTWLADPYAFYALLIMTLWGLGGGMIISLAALQDVPAELEEAARLDGAGTWRTIWNVTVPLISPMLYFQVITGIIASLQVLVQPLLLAETSTVSQSSNVPTSSTMYMVEVYNEFFFNHRFGFGSAMLWIFFVIVLSLTLILQRASRRFVFYQVDTDVDEK